MTKRERGGSNWLTVLPVTGYGFTLNKGEFRDSILLIKKWQRTHQSRSNIRMWACQYAMTINHALNYHRGGYIFIRHNDVRDFLAEHLLASVCIDVKTEPKLKPGQGIHFSRTTLKGEQARLGIRARGFYWAGQHTFSVPRKKVYIRTEQAKRSSYIERILNLRDWRS